MRGSGSRDLSLSRVLFAIPMAILLLTSVLFAVTAVALEDAGRAWLVLSGVQSPYGEDAALATALSIAGYLVVPAVLGFGVSAAAMTWVERRLRPLAEAEDELRREFAALKAAAEHDAR